MTPRKARQGFAIQSVDFSPGRWRPFVRVFAFRDGQPYELTCLTPNDLLEVYDHPRAWGGLPRFLGYAPAHVTRKLLTMAHQWLNARTVDAADFCSRLRDVRGAS